MHAWLSAHASTIFSALGPTLQSLRREREPDGVLAREPSAGEGPQRAGRLRPEPSRRSLPLEKAVGAPSINPATLVNHANEAFAGREAAALEDAVEDRVDADRHLAFGDERRIGSTRAAHARTARSAA